MCPFSSDSAFVAVSSRQLISPFVPEPVSGKRAGELYLTDFSSSRFFVRDVRVSHRITRFFWIRLFRERRRFWRLWTRGVLYLTREKDVTTMDGKVTFYFIFEVTGSTQFKYNYIQFW